LNENTASFLAQQLYPDLKSWLASLAKQMRTPVKKANAKTFKTTIDLLNALKKMKYKLMSGLHLNANLQISDHF
jgi:hypothetical protein